MSRSSQRRHLGGIFAFLARPTRHPHSACCRGRAGSVEARYTVPFCLSWHRPSCLCAFLRLSSPVNAPHISALVAARYILSVCLSVAQAFLPVRLPTPTQSPIVSASVGSRFSPARFCRGTKYSARLPFVAQTSVCVPLSSADKPTEHNLESRFRASVQIQRHLPSHCPTPDLDLY